MLVCSRDYPAEVSFRLPPSKSILARVVLLRLVEEVAYGRVLSYMDLPVDEPSADVSVMFRFADYFHQHIAPNCESRNEQYTFDCGESGTALRLLTAFCSALPIHIRLTAHGHLNHRPMQELLHVLEGWGASFDYENEREYMTPITIHGTHLVPSPDDILDTNQWRSSQFVSALILIAPLVGSDFSILRDANSPSSKYIQLTISVMRSFGYDIKWQANKIKIAYSPSGNISSSFFLESDWSSASYWYQLMLLHPEVDACHLCGLHLDSPQPDAAMVEVFEQLGISTASCTDGVKLSRIDSPSLRKLTWDCAQCPDLFPALFGALLGLRCPFVISGLRLLHFKESDRIHAMIHGAEILGYHGFEVDGDTVCWEVPSVRFVPHAVVPGFGDHRVVMAFAILATALADICVDIGDIDAVAKSYPDFFRQLSQ